jgi:hypothetical protein
MHQIMTAKMIQAQQAEAHFLADMTATKDLSADAHQIADNQK